MATSMMVDLKLNEKEIFLFHAVKHVYGNVIPA